MRTWMIVLTAVALAGCAGGANRVDATGPTVSYDVDSPREFEQAAARADDWCEDKYNLDARLVDSDAGYHTGNETVTFECAGD